MVLQNVDRQTVVRVSRMEARSSQSKTLDFTTGQWSGKPRAREGTDGCVVRLETAGGPKFLHLEKDHLAVVDLAPTLDGAHEIQFQESEAAPPGPTITSMRAMEPMRPMEPMQPLQPLN